MFRLRNLVRFVAAAGLLFIALVFAAVAWDAGWPPPLFGEAPVPIATLPYLTAGTEGPRLAHPFAPGANVSLKSAGTSPDGQYRLEVGGRWWGRWFKISLVELANGKAREVLAVREMDEFSGSAFDFRWSADSTTAYVLGKGRFVGGEIHPLCFAYDVARDTLSEAATCVDLWGRPVSTGARTNR